MVVVTFMVKLRCLMRSRSRRRSLEAIRKETGHRGSEVTFTRGGLDLCFVEFNNSDGLSDGDAVPLTKVSKVIHSILALIPSFHPHAVSPRLLPP